MKQININDHFQLFCFVPAASMPALLQELKAKNISYTLRQIGTEYKVMILVGADNATNIYNIFRTHISSPNTQL